MSLNEILASGGALLLFLTLVQITPIKVNPWSAVGKIIRNGMRAIGKSMNKDVMDKLESVQKAVSYTHLRAHETRHDLVCRLLLEKKKTWEAEVAVT